MFTDSYAYELKNKSVTQKTFGISLMIHTLIGVILLLTPFPKAAIPQAAEPEKQFIKIISPGDFAPQKELSPSMPPLPPPPPANISQPPRETAATIPATPIQETSFPATPVAKTKEAPPPPNPSSQMNAETTSGIAGGTSGGVLGGTLAGAPAGKPGGTPGAGQGASLDSVRSRFISALERNKEYPYIARKQNQTGTVGVLVNLDESGSLQNVQVTKSSGFSQLDNAAIILVRKICPFAHSAGKAVTMNISINYDLKG